MATRGNGVPKFETVRYETKGAICHIVLNRPEKLNAATDQLVEEVNDALFEFDAEPELRVAILSGAGRAFCSGDDVQQGQLRTREELRRLGGPAGRRSRENGLADAVNWKPVIAAVHGWALGLGYSLAQSCGLVVAAARTKVPIREGPRGARPASARRSPGGAKGLGEKAQPRFKGALGGDLPRPPGERGAGPPLPADLVNLRAAFGPGGVGARQHVEPGADRVAEARRVRA